MKKLEYIILKSIISLLKIVPFGWGHIITLVFAFLIRRIFRYRIHTVKDNIKKAFPDISEKEINKLQSDVYYNFAALWLEFLQNWRVDEQFLNNYFTIHNWDVFEAVLKENRGVILLTGHIGNIEWLGQCMSIKLPEVYAIGQRIHNKYVDDYVIKSRTQHGAKLILPKGALKRGNRILKENKVLAIAADQDAREKGIFVDFFGVPSSTAKGTAIFHIETGAPIVFAAFVRKKWGHFDLYFERLPDTEKGEDIDQNIFNVTQMHTRILEKWIKKYPGQYFWTHRRWKTKPSKKDISTYEYFMQNFNLQEVET